MRAKNTLHALTIRINRRLGEFTIHQGAPRPLRHECLYLSLEAIDEDDPRLRISAILGLPRMMLRRSENLMYQLVVRLDDPDPTVSDLAWETLERIAPIFPSSSELDMEALLRKTSKKQRDRAFKVLKAISKEWVEAGCQHIELLLKDEDVDLRRRSAKLLRVITERGGAVGWDLIAWAWHFLWF